jgi:hypothetical protein
MGKKLGILAHFWHRGRACLARMLGKQVLSLNEDFNSSYDLYSLVKATNHKQ